MSSLCAALPRPGSGSNTEQIDRAQRASSPGPGRTGMSSQAEKKTGLRRSRRGWRMTGSHRLYPTFVGLALIGLSLQNYSSYRHRGKATPSHCGYFVLEIGSAAAETLSPHAAHNLQMCSFQCAHRFKVHVSTWKMHVCTDACIATHQHLY